MKLTDDATIWVASEPSGDYVYEPTGGLERTKASEAEPFFGDEASIECRI